MKRRTFDGLLSWAGLAITVILVLSGGALLVAHNFATSNVNKNLTAQKIFFPPAGDEALASPQIGPYLNKYAGQQLTTGAQAEAYANHFIAVHLSEVADGKTYSEVSNLSRANPDDAVLAEQVQTLFRGETLRGLLLNAYAFGVFGTIALWAALGAFVGAAVMGLLTVLGFIHSRRVSAEEEIGRPTVVAAAA
ncbi:MAG TPA: hypothetical protein VNN79_08390 [Actinomycetota bacterium]|nr:hypothetical protein [Actinomycetota bacterium]